ncbi:HTH_Tnp_Tc3_2 domain-containing protein [Trichonephila inaurata madagascariensis]|uniref:HTH_Tnp_Tc3_2 domain-containing protein n=1 Tax=Trichonephila inaurata madagascariensis TaxID=2747483 RepID=A0A8X6XCK8_9ARAC|nr:HTH_Tnp_Tc3_2 domain-containing protein [Trichonephila inaurata madagascariensis]
MDPEVKLAAEMSQIIGRSAKIVRNAIRQDGYKNRVVRKKPSVSLQKQKKLWEFAKTHLLKTNNFWKKLYLVKKMNSTFLTVKAVAPYGDSQIPL